MTITERIFSFATLTLIVALILGSISAWYSILGLMAIFAAAQIPIIIMGASLELAKVTTTVWLHKYWNRAGWKLKAYLVPAVVTLAFLTSLGCFGFLSKSHADQNLVSGDIQSKIEIYDQKINTAKSNIESSRKALQQMDAAVDQTVGRSTDVRGVSIATNIRRSQATERNRLNSEIQSDQELIQKLTEESAPIRAEIRKVEAEVGPIKYIAAMIYGDNPDANLLEKAVRWVIIIIVFVFDPLALVLVLAAQSSYRWLEEDHAKKEIPELPENTDEKWYIPPEEVNTDLFSGLDNIPEIQPLADIIPDNTEFQNAKDFHEYLDEVWGDAYPEYELQDTIVPDPIEETIPDPIQETTQEQLLDEGITYPESENGYVMVDGKMTSKAALSVVHPDLIISPDNTGNYGTKFPSIARKGDVFVRTDVVPNRVYKFDGEKHWIEVNKDYTDTYLFDLEYIKFLVEKLNSGEYDVDLLSEKEIEQVESYLASANTK